MFKIRKKDKKQDKNKLNLNILKRIWRDHTKKYIWALIGAMAITSLTAMTEAYSVSLLKPIFDKGFIDRDNKVGFVMLSNRVHPTRKNTLIIPFRSRVANFVMTHLEEFGKEE